MISVTRVCTKCGAEIPADAPEGGCPGCLLESGLRLLEQEAVPEVDGGSASPKTINAFGERVPPHRSERFAEMLGELGDYELLEEVGRGGQGVVFRARQKNLNRIVALKVISLGQWASKEHLKRFRREAEAAAKLEHPGIVPIHDVGERDGSCYFSMKFVEGGQLDEVVRCTPISVRHAAELIAKVARTVHYAHEHGILHRDIKPGNILLDENGEPHLTDFGLARLLDAQSSVTRTIDVLGTPSYMAPEQAAGDTGKLSKATDVYGLGAVLYQLLTGQPPFAGGTTYETIRLLRDTEPRPPRSLNSKIDRDLSTICLKCLDKDSQRRYPSALALAEDLEHWLKHEPIQAKPSGLLTHGRKWVRRNPSTTVQVALLLALAVGLSVTLWNRKPAIVIPKSVAVLPFENLSDDKENAYLADGIQQEILTRMAGIADLKVISHTSTQQYQSKPRNLREIAKQLGVANILEGSVQKTADHVRVNVQLINAQTDSHLWAETFDRKLTDIFGVESEIAKGIAESLKVKLTGREKEALAVKPTNIPEAYEAYLRGLSLDERNNISSYSIELGEKAAGFFEQAVQLDPKFAVAWARLSRTDYFISNSSKDPTVAAARKEAAKRALDQAQKLAPDTPETLMALAGYQYMMLQDPAAAIATTERVRQMLPGSGEVRMYLGTAARNEGHWDQSVAYFEQALALDPRNLQNLTQAALTYAGLRQFPAALRLFDRVLDIQPNDPDAVANKARIYQALGNLQEAARLLSGIDETSSGAAYETKTSQLEFERNYGELIRLQQARVTQHGSDGDQMNLAIYQWMAGDTAGAKVTAKKARDGLEQSSREERRDGYLSGLIRALSLAYALMGEKDAALKLAERASMLWSRGGAEYVGYAPTYDENLALIQTIVGENSHAISTLTHLLQTPYPGLSYAPAPVTRALLRLDPSWDPLRGDPAFQKLCEEKVDRSIAVLPFENLSRDRENAYFADGIQEEILTRLAKIADLKVISHTSTHRYKSKPDDIGEIAKELGVANILEGSVQKAADKVRVNVQLINAQTDSHLWADTYDRKVTDMFEAESEIAKRVAETLQAKLTGREQQALADKPTNNPEAYEAYLHGLSLDERNYTSSPSIDLEEKAAASYEQAVQLDPQFAVAWARLSLADTTISSNSNDPAAAVARKEAAKRALDQAQKLAPDTPDTLRALGGYQYLMIGDPGATKATLERFIQIVPGSSEARMYLGTLARNEGHWDQSVAYHEQALALDPRNAQNLIGGIMTYVGLRQFPAALKLCDRVLDIKPNDPDAMAIKARIYQALGNLQEAARLLSGINETSSGGAYETKTSQLQFERNYGELIRLQQVWVTQHDSDFDQMNLAIYQWLAGDKAGAKVTAKKACNGLEQSSREEHKDIYLAGVMAALSQGYALMGEKESALKLAERAIMLYSGSGGAWHAPAFEENLALIQTIVGENSRAIATLTHVLQTPYIGNFYGSTPVTPALLKLDPFWDPLRGDPAFQKLCEEKQDLTTKGH